MAEITARRSGELVRGVFQILREAPEGVPAGEVLERLAETVPPTSFEASDYPNRPGVRRYERIVRFSTIRCVKAGWMQKLDGRWSLTEAGRKAYDVYSDPEVFTRKAKEGYRQWELEHESNDESTETGAPGEETPAAFGALEEAEERAVQEINAWVVEMDPYDFQQLVAGLIQGMGYFVDWIAPRGPDGGVDAIAYSDTLGARGPTIRISVRRRVQAQNVDDVRSFLSTLHGDDVGLSVATGGFTRDAEDLARHDPRKIRLINLQRFVELWKEYYERVPESERALLPMKAVYFLDPRKAE